MNQQYNMVILHLQNIICSILLWLYCIETINHYAFRFNGCHSSILCLLAYENLKSKILLHWAAEQRWPGQGSTCECNNGNQLTVVSFSPSQWMSFCHTVNVTKRKTYLLVISLLRFLVNLIQTSQDVWGFIYLYKYSISNWKKAPLFAKLLHIGCSCNDQGYYTVVNEN